VPQRGFNPELLVSLKECLGRLESETEDEIIIKLKDALRERIAQEEFRAIFYAA
jgi:hypothetical protein